MIIVRPELSKTGHQYPTFLCEEGCEIVKTYLDQRIREGERLSSESGIIVTTSSQAKRSMRFGLSDSSPFLATSKVSEAIRQVMRATGLPWRPYVFRSYFDTNMIIAENRGLVSHAFVQCWMGHNGDMEAPYSTNKKQLPPDLLESMIQSYQRQARSSRPGSSRATRRTRRN